MKDKKVGVVLIIILILAAICIFIFFDGKSEKTSETNVINKQSNIIENNIVEIKNEINEIANVVSNEINENTLENNQNTETIQGGSKTAEQKAIDIVKADWKDTNNVDISIDGLTSDGKHIVAVRQAQTTQALAFYTVDTVNGTFTKKEMN